jgi:Tfp pilus assembly protein PilV
MAPLEGSAQGADVGGVKVRLGEEKGFGLIELLMAMVMLNVGILAIVAAFQSGAVSLQRASHITTASAIADAQMELYRALVYDQIVLDAAQLAGTDQTYKCDGALSGCSTSADVTGTCSTVDARACNPSRLVSDIGDKFHYRVDSYIVYNTPPSGRQLKQITVVVRDAGALGKTYARQTSTFDSTVNG